MKTLLCFCYLALFCLSGCQKQSVSVPQLAPSSLPSLRSTKSVPKIVAFGDSLTAGFGLSQQQSYPAFLEERLRRDGFQYEVVNSGISGDTSAGGLRRIDWALDDDVRFVILELGANDFLRGQPAAETKKNLAAIIDHVQARGAVVILAGMYAPTSFGREYEVEIHNL